jgi:hypothetical protein
LFAFKNARGVVLDSLADHDFAANIHEVEHAADRIAGRGIGLFLFAAPEPGQGIERRCLRRPNEIQFDDSLDVVVILLWNSHGLRLAKSRPPDKDSPRPR